MKKKFNDKEYWKKRHSKEDIKAVGQKSISVKGNHHIYLFLQEQYEKLLSEINMNEVKSFFDCGFGDGYFLKYYSKKFPHIKLSGIDISTDAKIKVDFIDSKFLFVGDLATMETTKKYDIVQSFDVLYHILNDSDHYESLVNMSKISSRYIILHERFSAKTSLTDFGHERTRRSEYTNQILNSQGFYLYREIPSHFFAIRLFTYRLNSYIPGLLYKIDKYIANNLHDSRQEYLASHFIRIYKKKA